MRLQQQWGAASHYATASERCKWHPGTDRAADRSSIPPCSRASALSTSLFTCSCCTRSALYTTQPGAAGWFPSSQPSAHGHCYSSRYCAFCLPVQRLTNLGSWGEHCGVFLQKGKPRGMSWS